MIYIKIGKFLLNNFLNFYSGITSHNILLIISHTISNFVHDPEQDLQNRTFCAIVYYINHQFFIHEKNYCGNC